MLLGEAPPREDVPCTQCERYHERRRDASWVTPAQIRRDALEKRLKESVHAFLARMPCSSAFLRALSRVASWARWRA